MSRFSDQQVPESSSLAFAGRNGEAVDVDVDVGVCQSWNG